MQNNQLYSQIISNIRRQLDTESEKELFGSAILKWREGQDIIGFQGFLRGIHTLRKEILNRVAPEDAIRVHIPVILTPQSGDVDPPGSFWYFGWLLY